MEVNVTDMNINEEITIHTEFSEYSFRVTDPVLGRGLLKGGRLGALHCEAIFLETLLPANGDRRVSRYLETGGRAVFLIGLHNPNKFTTSYISEIYLAPTSVISSS